MTASGALQQAWYVVSIAVIQCLVQTIPILQACLNTQTGQIQY